MCTCLAVQSIGMAASQQHRRGSRIALSRQVILGITCVCRVLAEASAELCACDVPHRAVIASAADADALLTALRCAGIQDLEVCSL